MKGGTVGTEQGRRVEYMPLTLIEPALRNPKEHAEKEIRASIDRFGVAELPLIDERTGRLVAGHGRLDQVAAMRVDGQAPPDGVRLSDTGEWLVPIIRGWASRSDAEAESYLLASNKLTIRGGWDNDELAEILTGLAEEDAELLALTGFTEDELSALLATPDGDGPDGDPDGDGEPGPPPAEPVTVKGDVWLLGPHRLLCGDSLNPDDVDRVLDGVTPGIIYTDPPYGINAVPKDGGASRSKPFGSKNGGSATKPIAAGGHTPIIGDDTAEIAADAYRLMMASYPVARHVWWGANHYASAAGLADASCWLVWDKENTGDFADAELAWTNHSGAVRLLRHMWNGMLRASEHGKRVHPTQKPAALATWAFEVVDPRAEAATVLDAFGGSGSTLIAAHETDRVAYVIELEPGYVDVMCRRFQEHTGVVPVLESTGEPVSFAKAEE